MKGFTLIELVLTITILGVLSMVIAPNMFNAIKGYDLVGTRRLVLAEGRAGVERMAKEIRLIPGAAQITSVAAQNFQFQYPTGTSIAYTLSGTNLLRNSNILIGNINALTFTYYDESGTSTLTAANVRSVGILFTIDSPGAIANYTLRTRVFLPNTGNNYDHFTSP